MKFKGATMLEWLKENYALVSGFVLVVLGLGKLRWDVENLKSQKFVAGTTCLERQKGCNKINEVQFQAGDDRFSALEKAVDKLTDSHERLVTILLEKKK